MLQNLTEWLLDLSDSANTFSQLTTVASDNFELWFLTNGGYINPAIEITSSISDGTFLRVDGDEALLPGAKIISCPHKLTISWPSIRKYHLKNVSSTMRPHVATRLFLMKQYILRERSPWWPYIKILPQPYQNDAFNTPLYYNASEMAWIRGTNLEYARQVREDAWRKEYDDAIQETFRNDFTAEDCQIWTWELYLWAATIMTSRSFPGPALLNRDNGDKTSDSTSDNRSPAVMPGLDLLNHNPSAQVAWLWDLNSCNIKTDEIICQGSQAWNNYGPKSNAELIMGYGFSLPNNQADHFSIAFSPAISAYIRSVRAYRSAMGSKAEHEGDANNGAENEDLRMKNGQPMESVDIIETEEPAEKVIHWVSTLKSDYEFSPCFLADFAIAVENHRERGKLDNNPPDNGNFWDSPLSRNKLHVICAVFMILQKGQGAIKKHDEDLPQCPENVRQIDAARYRRSQLQILETVLSSLGGSLKSYVGFNTSSDTKSVRIIRLEHTLISSPQRMLKDFRNVLKAGIKSRDPKKIRQRGGTDFAFTVWLCGLWASQDMRPDQEGKAHADAELEPRFLLWLQFLSNAYPENAETKQWDGNMETDTHGMDGTEWFDPIRNKEAEGDLSLVIASYLDAIRVAVAKHPQSLYNDPKITAERLQWCLNIVRMEGVWYPNLQEDGQEEEDEWMLFLDFNGTERKENHFP